MANTPTGRGNDLLAIIHFFGDEIKKCEQFVQQLDLDQTVFWCCFTRQGSAQALLAITCA